MNPLAPLHLSSDHLHVSILPRGATLAAVRFGQDQRNLVIGFADTQDHLAVPIYAGALVGPIANRIKDGLVDLGGTRHQMARNEGGRTALHSGPDGLHAQDWDILAHAHDHLDLAITLKDGDQGLPGRRQITATYRLKGDCLTLDLSATTDRPTPMNIAAHPYWRLDEHPDISGQKLQVMATHYLPTDADNLPTGQVAPVANTGFDFTTPRLVPLTPALDVNFCLATVDRPTPLRSAQLTGQDGTRLVIATTAPGLQVYNGAFIPALNGCRDDGGDLGPYAAIALEPQGWPNAPHHPGFPQITLYPGQIWRQITTYRLAPAP